ncbi:MAG TPA: hypothetical protein VGM96_10925 [Reyranella sp.]
MAQDVEPAPDFSLVLGGPLYQLWLRSRLARPPLDLLHRRVVAFVAVCWLPLPILALTGGEFLPSGNGRVPLLYDIEAHVRFLVVLPLLIGAEIPVHQRLRGVLHQFLTRGIIRDKDRARFDALVANAMALRNSMALEIVLLLLVYTVGHWLWVREIALDRTNWYVRPGDDSFTMTLPGTWYAWVSIPLFQFVLARWYIRLFIWYRLLWRISRLDLHMVPTHPDHAAGIGFVGNSVYAFLPLLFAQGALLSGWVADRVVKTKLTVLDFKVDVVLLVGFLVAALLLPLAVFMPKLAEAKRMGRRQYGLLASQYTTAFERKWVGGERLAEEPLLGTSDIQSLADLANSYGQVQDTRLLPFGLNLIAHLAVATAIPLLPLIFTVLSFDSIVVRLFKILF